MTTTAISRRPQPGEPRKAATGPTYSVLLPMLAALAVICASAALGGVLAGPVWFADIVVAALLIAVTGIVLRKLRVSGMVIPLVQLLVLLCLLVTMFTSSGMFVVLPGPSALGDLGGLLARSMDTIRTEVPPVHPAAPVLCLIVMLLGLVSVLVDLLVFTARAPAAAGLPLLCVYAVPASLDDAMLPWWSFVLGVAAFCLLLAADRARLRRQWRGRAGLPQRRTPGAASTAATVACLAMVVALIAGSAFTAVGTAGRLPGSGSGTGPAGQLGIKPFTTLRGLLDQGNKDTELFRVSGLAQGSHYLRALTLRDYLPNQGWVITQPMPRGVRPHGLLPTTQGVHERGPVTTVRIDPVNWTDVWLPVYGTPEVLGDVPIFWHYDAGTGIVYSERQRHPAPYTERTQLAEPSAQGLRKAGTDYHGINKDYLAVPPASSRVVALATRLTAGSSDPFDKASAIYRYFTTPSNGFTYSTRTAAATSSDALADFLFRGKTGFCEQYASAMAVLLREAGIPSRVGIGFTSGSKQAGGYRSITAKDAHAWVEVYFPGYGWQTFDPTPLADGRGYTPSYLSGDPSNGNDTLTAGKLGRTGQGASSGAQLSGKHAAPQPQAGHAIGSQPSTTFGGLPWIVLVLALLAAALTLLGWLSRRGNLPGGVRLPSPLRRWRVPAAAALWAMAALLAAALVSWWLLAALVTATVTGAPMAIRQLRRRRRLGTVSTLGASAAGAAWAEVVAEAADRGERPSDHDTIRITAQRLVTAHGLDANGERGMHWLVGAVEREWYGGHSAAHPDLPDALAGVRASFARNNPLSLRAKLFPRSVLRPRR